MFFREFALCLSINYAHICAWIGRSLKKFSGARSRDLIAQTKQISWEGLFDIAFWESKWISPISLVCAAVLNESETPLKKNLVFTIYISSSNAILLLLSSWFSSVAGPSLACGRAFTYHAPSKKLEEEEKMEAGRRDDTHRACTVSIPESSILFLITML